jgi:hypothetical protein
LLLRLREDLFSAVKQRKVTAQGKHNNTYVQHTQYVLNIVVMAEPKAKMARKAFHTKDIPFDTIRHIFEYAPFTLKRIMTACSKTWRQELEAIPTPQERSIRTTSPTSLVVSRTYRVKGFRLHEGRVERP